MKILEVIPRFNPILGGGVDVVYNVSKQLCLFGHDVTIVTSDYKYDAAYAKTIEDLGVKVIPFHAMCNFKLFIPTLDFSCWLNEHINEYDIIHLNGTRSYQNNLIHKYAIKYHIPYVLQPHGSFKYIGAHTGIKRMYDIVWGNRLIHDATGFIVLSASEADQLMQQNILMDKISIVPNGVDLSKFEKLPKPGLFRLKYGISDNELVILYLGRLHETKGIDLLILAYSRITNSMDNIRLVIVGPDGGCKEQLMNLAKANSIENKILFTGPVSELEKFSAFVDSDIFVTPRFYGFPITFAESMACGLPIITTNNGDYLDFIDGNVGYSTGYSVDALSNAIISLLSNNDEYNKLKENCIHAAQQIYNWQSIVVQLLKEYRRYI